MADETSTDTPLADLAAAEKKINPPIAAQDPPSKISLEPGSTPEGWKPQDEPISAVDRLRAFEDEKLGADTPRQQGAIERGVGSHFSRMSDADKAMHAKIEKLVVTEAKLAAAHSALIAADIEHDAALAAVDG